MVQKGGAYEAEVPRGRWWWRKGWLAKLGSEQVGFTTLLQSPDVTTLATWS